MFFRIMIRILIIFLTFSSLTAIPAARSTTRSISITPPVVMAGQYLMARVNYAGERVSTGSAIILHVGDSYTLSQQARDISTFHFDGENETLLGSHPIREHVTVSGNSPFGDGCLRMTGNSKLVFNDLSPVSDEESGTVLMWVAPDTQTVFVTPEQALFYEKAGDHSKLLLSLSRHHLKASWTGRGYGSTGDKKSAMDAREWHLVGMSWGQPRKDRVTIYRDDCFWYSSKHRYLPGSEPVEIGIGTGIGRTVSFEGWIDEVMIAHPALTNEEVAALYRAGSEHGLPFPDQFMVVEVDTSWQNDTLWFEYVTRSGDGRMVPATSSQLIIPEPAHAELHLDLSGITTTPFDLIGAELTYDCYDPESTSNFPGVRMWDSENCRGPEEDTGHPRKRMVESVRNFQVDRVGSPLIRFFWNGGEGAYYRFGKNADDPPDRVDHAREFMDSLSTGFTNSIMLLAETAQSDESTSDFDTSLVRYMLNRYDADRPRYYEFINEMIYAEGWGTKSDRDSALVWDWRDGYYRKDGRCWTHMIEDTLSWFFEAAHTIDDDLKFGWFIDRQGGWNFDGTPAGAMDEWVQDSILLSNDVILDRTGFLAFHDYFPISMGRGSRSLGEGLSRAVGSLGWTHAYLNPRTWRLFAKYFGHPEWELIQTEYNTAAVEMDRRMPKRAARLYDTWAGAWANISNLILRYRSGQIDKAVFFKPAYSYGDTPHATINLARGKAHRTVIEKTFGLYGGLMRDSTITSDSIWTYGFRSGKTSHNWGKSDLPVFDAISTVSPDTDTVAILLVNRDWKKNLKFELFLGEDLFLDPVHDTAFFHHVEFGPTSRGATDEPDTSLLESWGKGYYYASEGKFDSTDVNFVCDTLPGFSQNMSLDIGRGAFGVLVIPVKAGIPTTVH